jgi:hypothetical protein
MKSIQRVTRVQLKTDQKPEFRILGIVSADADYKLSLAINRMLGISLKNISPLQLKDESGKEVSFSSDTADAPDIVFTLISNRSGNNFLIRKLKNVDYIFLVHDAENESIIDQRVTNLKKIDSVNAVFKVGYESLKDKNLQYLTH